jgi:hypothetical protein
MSELPGITSGFRQQLEEVRELRRIGRVSAAKPAQFGKHARMTEREPPGFPPSLPNRDQRGVRRAAPGGADAERPVGAPRQRGAWRPAQPGVLLRRVAHSGRWGAHATGRPVRAARTRTAPSGGTAMIAAHG